MNDTALNASLSSESKSGEERSPQETQQTEQERGNETQKNKNNVLAFLHRDQAVTPKELYEFLPAAIEVEQTPASPAGRQVFPRPCHPAASLPQASRS